MAEVKIQFTGMSEFMATMDEMKADIGPKDSKKILNAAMRQAMKPVLASAKALVSKDTGALMASLQIEARKPNSKDKKSVYVNPTDVVIGTVSTAPGSKLAKKRFQNLHNKKSKIKQVGIRSDARAIANEFGTAKMAARPFLRPAMEAAGPAALNSLATSLRQALDKYKAKNSR